MNFSVKYFSILFLISSFSLFAQVIPPAEPIEEEEETEKPVLFENPKAAWKSKVHYGGNLWLGFFGSFYIDASPMAGYDVTGKGTVLGLGASFIFQGQYRNTGVLAYGGRLFLRQAVWRSIFVQGEYEHMNADKTQFYNSKVGEDARQWGGSPLIGAGLYQGRTRQQRGSFVSVMYNLGAPNKGFISPQGLGGGQLPLVLRIGYFF
jgi:hypothetical protein